MEDGKATVVSRLMAVKSNSGKPYSQLAEETGLTNVYVAQLLKRQAQLKPETAPKLRAALPGLPDELVQEMMKPPMRSYNPNLIQEPTIYRLNEAVMHFGESIKEIINEEFGDGIMSAIDFYCSVDKTKGADGKDRVLLTFDGKYLPHTEQTNVFTRCSKVVAESEADVSIRSSEVVSDCVMDYSNEFTTYEIFKSRDALLKWIREVGKRNGLVIVIKTSDAGGHGKRPRVTFACERGGHYRKGSQNIEGTKKRPNMIGTKKCGCPFALKGQKLATDDDWMLEVVCGVHNHSAEEEHLDGHSFAGRLSQEETSLLVDMCKSSARPKDILTTLKKRDALNVTTMKTIYNARQRFKVTEKARRLENQQPGILSIHTLIVVIVTTLRSISTCFRQNRSLIDLLSTLPRVTTINGTIQYQPKLSSPHRDYRSDICQHDFLGRDLDFMDAIGRLFPTVEGQNMYALGELQAWVKSGYVFRVRNCQVRNRMKSFYVT